MKVTRPFKIRVQNAQKIYKNIKTEDVYRKFKQTKD